MGLPLNDSTQCHPQLDLWPSAVKRESLFQKSTLHHSHVADSIRVFDMMSEASLLLPCLHTLLGMSSLLQCTSVDYVAGERMKGKPCLKFCHAVWGSNKMRPFGLVLVATLLTFVALTVLLSLGSKIPVLGDPALTVELG